MVKLKTSFGSSPQSSYARIIDWWLWCTNNSCFANDKEK